MNPNMIPLIPWLGHQVLHALQAQVYMCILLCLPEASTAAAFTVCFPFKKSLILNSTRLGFSPLGLSKCGSSD